MEDPISLPPEVDELIDLGTVLGQNQAFGLIAGRCSSVQAEGLRRLRDQKVYKRVARHWRDFCPQYLRMSGAQADKIIRLLEEFGAGYFELSQLTRISPETYRALAPAVENGVLHLNGETIELTIENSRKVTDAVARVRRTLPSKPPASLPALPRIARFEQLGSALLDEFSTLPDPSAPDYLRYRLVLINLFAELRTLRKRFDF